VESGLDLDGDLDLLAEEAVALRADAEIAAVEGGLRGTPKVSTCCSTGWG
jgi:hypothetical protein